MRDLQDTMTVVVGVQARQAAALKDSAEWLDSLQRAYNIHQQKMEEHDRRMEKVDERLAEMTEKLDALIDIVANHKHHGPPPQQA
jgi:uncharacterized coiled-coil protein SlyX